MRNLHSAIPGAKSAAPDSPNKAATAASEGGEEPTSEPEAVVKFVSERTIVLELWDNAIRCEEVEKALLTIKGVISCVSMSETRAVRVIAKLEGQTLVEQLKELGLSVEVVDEKEGKDEDEGDREYQQSLISAGENSLAARLARQREERLKERQLRAQQESNMSKFFRKVTTSLW